MTLPSLVTTIRVGLSPLFFALFTTLTKNGEAPLWAAILYWGLFIVMEITDLLDGKIARKTGSVTDFGKFYDPFADSFSRLTYFLAFLVTGFLPAWVFLLVLYRDITVSFVRLLAMRKNIVISARPSGKIKAVIYAVACGAVLTLVTARAVPALAFSVAVLAFLQKALMWITAATAVWTTLDYSRGLKPDAAA
ncbi:MAG: CDP-diacylglycerol--glycerol-3-phosphate 3-phosphatidyltransferase [Treponema sp.]|nr:CDP-diacylglycerol--glycerol-3-phosphate 3-phosphatidyltransferase [Treponema sp.]